MIAFWIYFIILWGLLGVYHYQSLVNDRDGFHFTGGVLVAFVTLGFIGYPYLELDANILLLFFVSLTIRWNVHDIVYNYMDGKDYWYVGSSTTDKVFGHSQFVIKWILLLTLIILSCLM